MVLERHRTLYIDILNRLACYGEPPQAHASQHSHNSVQQLVLHKPAASACAIPVRVQIFENSNGETRDDKE